MSLHEYQSDNMVQGLKAQRCLTLAEEAIRQYSDVNSEGEGCMKICWSVARRGELADKIQGT